MIFLRNRLCFKIFQLYSNYQHDSFSIALTMTFYTNGCLVRIALGSVCLVVLILAYNLHTNIKCFLDLGDFSLLQSFELVLSWDLLFFGLLVCY